jgi:hypothetical protein
VQSLGGPREAAMPSDGSKQAEQMEIH